MDEHPTDVDPDRGFRTPHPNPVGTGPGGAAPAADSDSGAETGSGEDQTRRAADLKPSKETGQPGSSADRPPALDPDS
jgi:hypothetical protein